MTGLGAGLAWSTLSASASASSASASALALVTPRKLWRLFDGFDWSIVWAQRSNLLRGVGLLAWVALASMVLSVVVGALVASARRSQVKPVRWLAWAYIQLFRGISLYVLVIWMFFGLAAAAQWRLPAATAGIVALTLLHSAYLAEAFRAALAVIPPGQHEAAAAVGLSRLTSWRYVIGPQFVRVALPVAGNQLVDIVKDSAILSVIGVRELFRETQRWSQFYSAPFEFYTAAGLIYLGLVLVVARGVRILERRLQWGVSTARS